MKACALTCKVLYYSARALLRRNINGNWGCIGLSPTLKLALAQRPVLRSHIHTLGDRLGLDDLRYLCGFAPAVDTLEAHSIQTRGLLADPHLNMGFPNVTELEIFWYKPESVSDFIRMLNCFPHLTSLDISAAPSDDQQLWEFQQEDELLLPYLREVYFDPPRLARALPSITRAAGASLRRLELRPIVHPYGLISDILDLSQNIHLTYLVFQLLTWRDPWDERLLAAFLVHVSASHTSLMHVAVCLPTGDTQLEFRGGGALGGELSRVMGDLPPVTITFYHSYEVAEAWRRACCKPSPACLSGFVHAH